MQFDIKKSNQRLTGSLFIASALHVSLAAALALTSSLALIPEGTKPLQIDFTVQEASRGQQIVSTNMGKRETNHKGKGLLSKRASAQKATSAKFLTKKVKLKKKTVAKKQAPKGIVKKKLAKKKAIVTKKGIIPVVLPKKKIVQKTEPLKQEEGLKSVNVVGPINQPKKNQKDLDKELKAISDEIDDSENLKSDLLTAQRQQQAQPEKSLENNSLNNNKVNSTENQMAKGKGRAKMVSRKFGVRSGTRDYRDLKQRHGNIPPVYPALSQRRGQQGSGLLSYYVNANGNIDDIKVVQSTGYKTLDREAMRAISRFRYVPGQEGWTVHPFKFSLKGEAKPLGDLLRTRSSYDKRRDSTFN